MKMDCEIVRDLLPLYADGVCSEKTRKAVETHLQECEACRRELETAAGVSVPEGQTETKEMERAVVRSFRKIRVRWWTTLAAVLLLIPICVLGWGQIEKKGIHFTNLHELWIGYRFVQKLEEGDYEGAYGYMDVERLRDEWAENWFEAETMANIQEDGKMQFCRAAEALEEAGGVEEWRYIGVRMDGKHRIRVGKNGKADKYADLYGLIYMIKIQGEEHQVCISITDEGIEHFFCEGSFLTDPFAMLGMWSENLWQQYEGCWFDAERGQYIYD